MFTTRLRLPVKSPCCWLRHMWTTYELIPQKRWRDTTHSYVSPQKSNVKVTSYLCSIMTVLERENGLKTALPFIWQCAHTHQKKRQQQNCQNSIGQSYRKKRQEGGTDGQDDPQHRLWRASVFAFPRAYSVHGIVFNRFLGLLGEKSHHYGRHPTARYSKKVAVDKNNVTRYF